MSQIRILLADDHVPFRKGVASLLAAESGFDVVGEADDGLQALELARELTPDVILMDLSMPVMDGFEATRRIRAELPRVRVVILSVSYGAHGILEAVQCGASGFLPKMIEPQELYGTLREVVQGRPRAAGDCTTTQKS
jgi:DNA-binding NarL/FixJ family response regulator